MDSNQSGIDGGTIWGQMIIQGEQQYARLEMNQSASFSLIESLQFKEADEMILPYWSKNNAFEFQGKLEMINTGNHSTA